MTPQPKHDIHDQYLVAGIDCDDLDDCPVARAALMRKRAGDTATRTSTQQRGVSMRTHLGFGTAVLTLAMLVGGCANDPGDPPRADDTPTITPSNPPPPTPTAKTPDELAQTALGRYFTIAERAEKSGKPADLAPLSKVATGDAYLQERKRVLDYGANGVRLRGTIKHTLGDISTPSGSTFVIADCEDRSKSKVVVLKSGSEVPLTAPDGTVMPKRVRVDYTLTLRSKDEWVVESVDVRWRDRC